MSIALLIIFLFGFGYLAWKNFQFSLYFFVCLLPAYFIRFQIGPFPTTLLEAGFLVLFAFWILKQNGLKFRDPRIKNWRWPILFFLLSAVIGVIVSPDKTAGLGILKAYFIEPILFFIIIISTIKTKAHWHNIFKALALSAVVVAVFAIVQKFTGLAIPEAWAAERRVTSFFGYPNAVGLFLAPIIIACFILAFDFFKQKKWLNFGFFTLAFILSMIAVCLSQTEAAWIAVGSAIFIFMLFKKELRIPAILIAIVLILIIGLTPAIREPVMEKVLLQDWSGHVRRVTWSESLDMLKENFFFGAGLSGYPLKMIAYHRAEYLEIFQYPHNFILNFWSEIGLLGLAAWFWLTTKAGLAGLKNYKSNFGLILLAFVVVIIIHGLVDVPYFKNDLSMMYWLYLGLALWIKRT
jgi:O-antigen ligase